MRCRVSFLLRTYLVTVVIFIAAKIAFMLANADGHPFTAGDVFDVIAHGLTLDLSTALYVIALPFLCTIASIYCGDAKPLRIILRVYFALISPALALAFVADTSLYRFWQFKLDASCLQYLTTPGEAMASVSLGYLLLRGVAVAVVAGVVYGAYGAYGAHKAHGAYRAHGAHGAYGAQGRLLETGLYLLLIPLIVIGIRGGLGESTTNIGQVYYSQNQFLNHAAVNPVFSFLASLEKTASHVPDYQFMDEEERRTLTDGIFPTESIAPDTLLNTTRPDIVVILLESCGGIFTSDIGGRTDIMPQFNRLMDEGIYFENFYANSYRTDRGTLCTWSGYPSFPTSSVMKMPSKTRFLPGIAKTLRGAGYETTYLYGGDINFTNMRSYLIATGFSRLHWQQDYTREEQHSANWGVRDDITFTTLYDMITHEQSGDGNFLIGFSTLSSHEPWDVPTRQLDDEIPNAFRYLDDCIGSFISKVKATPQWDNLLVILLPDHGFTYFGVGEEHEMHDHVPMLWLGGAVRQPRRIGQLCNQTDLPATLLGQLGLPHDDFTFSRDVMSRNYTYPFAHHTYNNGITMRDSTGFAVFDLNANRIIVDKSTDSQALIRRGMAILQTASQHINQLGKQ